ncbi:MAG: DMT family transporter [Halomonas sp.]|nr:DMT family transporter [Halomonas sp.]MDN6297419.1 DMT family transporter [Halomonas sp.]MDN6314696.1 DMT family transporter [Halomonas sp.]MDN6336311.1 DMT family transporter [Halomonas sp.]
MHQIHLLSPRRFSIAAALVAVVLWSSAPLLAEQARDVAPLPLAALTLLAGALATMPLSRREPTRHLSVSWRFAIWLGLPLLTTGAVSSYFIGMRLAPASDAALITYTWPVLFILLSQWLTFGRVRFASVLGALIAFSGAALLMAPEAGGSGEGSLAGYGFAALAAVCWALYSWLCQATPVSLSPLMPRILLIASVITAAAFLPFAEGHVALPDNTTLLAGLAIGLGPFGIAMVAWDKALRFGRASVIGSLAYGVPVLAAAFLVLAGMSVLDWRLPIAGALVVGGCLQAGRR